MSVKSIKYMFKYIYKGHDRAQVAYAIDAVRAPADEIRAYEDGRYVSSTEAAWRIFGFHCHGKDPKVKRLPIHLPGEQAVVVQEDMAPGAVVG